MNWGGITREQVQRTLEEKKQNDLREATRRFEQQRMENEARLKELQAMAERQKQEERMAQMVKKANESKVKFKTPAVWDSGVIQVKRPVGKIVANTLGSWL